MFRSHCDERRSNQVSAVKLRTDGLQEGNGGLLGLTGMCSPSRIFLFPFIRCRT